VKEADKCKHSSLFQYGINYGYNKFHGTSPLVAGSGCWYLPVAIYF
jgi:hypothetical protein